MQIKDSGKRQQFDSGMVRDITEGKVDYSLVFDGPMFERWAQHLTLGAKKYDKRNWMKAKNQEELDRFRESAIRHFVQWLRGDTDEDHAAGVFFNLNGAEFTKQQIQDGGDLGWMDSADPVVAPRPYPLHSDKELTPPIVQHSVDDPVF